MKSIANTKKRISKQVIDFEMINTLIIFINLKMKIKQKKHKYKSIFKIIINKMSETLK